MLDLPEQERPQDTPDSALGDVSKILAVGLLRLWARRIRTRNKRESSSHNCLELSREIRPHADDLQ